MSFENIYTQNKLNHPLDSLKANSLREQAYTDFCKQGWPTKKEEAWKLTSVSEIKEIEWSLASDENLLSHEDIIFLSKQLSSDFYNLVFINGYLNQTLSDSELPLEIVEITETDLTVDASHPDFKLLNVARALGHQKIKISINKTSVLDKPLQILQVLSHKNSNLVQPLVEIKIDDHCELQLIHHAIGLGYTSIAQWINFDLNIQLGKAALLKLINLDNNKTTDYLTGRTHVQLSDKSQLTYLDLALGSKLSRHYVQTDFKGEQARAGVYGLSLLADQQHCDHYTYINHILGHNESDQHYKSILTDKSKSVFRGRVHIHQDAQKANSSQLNNNLLVSPAAQADSIPQLEIYADDVKAGHGSTVGQLNKEEIFYFLSRGIDEQQAISMLAYGYAKELIYKLENKNLENYLFKILDQKLSEIF